jgi:hypothetical protein
MRTLRPGSVSVTTRTGASRGASRRALACAWQRTLGIAAACVLAACTPKAPALSGDVVPAARVPSAKLAPGHRRLIFRWSYHDPVVSARGEGVARIAPPDSARLDFFLDGGMGGGYAIVVGDSVFTPNDAQARRYLPPVSLLWATLGRLAVPASPDTAARAVGATIRADIGRDPTWRASFDDAGRLVRLERITDGHIQEWVARAFTTPEGTVRFVNERAKRALDLTVQRVVPEGDYEAAIWRR